MALIGDTLHVHVHVHTHGYTKTIEAKLDEVLQNQKIMAKKVDEMNALLGEINESTNNIAADLDRIAGQIEGGLSAEEADSVVSQLGEVSAKLKEVAARNPETGEPTEPEA